MMLGGVPLAYLVEHILQLVLCESTALHILDGAELLGHPLAVLLPHRGHLLFGQLLPHARVVPQIYLGADDQARDAGAVMMDFREPFLADVLEGGWRGHGEADEEHVCLRVGQGTEPIVILLSSGIKQSERIGLVANPEETVHISFARGHIGYY